MHYELWAIIAGAAAGLACGFLNTVASSGSAVSLPILMTIGLVVAIGAELVHLIVHYAFQTH